MIPSPDFMSAVDWTDVAGSELERQFRAIIPRISRDDEWREWAQLVVDSPEIAKLSPPRPESYKTWQGWVVAFKAAVSVN